jgi:hypothetical protein
MALILQTIKGLNLLVQPAVSFSSAISLGAVCALAHCKLRELRYYA